MKKIPVTIGCLLLCLSLMGCENPNAVISEEMMPPENQVNYETATTVSEDKKEEAEQMSGELLKDTEDLSVNQEEKQEFSVSMTEVTEVFCPVSASTKNLKLKYGEKEGIVYYSNTTKCDRKANVLLPADYDTTKEYPVLYFLHGIFGDENSMLGDSNNHIIEIVGNLKAQGIIEDVIVVFPNMYASEDSNLQPGFSVEQTLPYDNFINDLVNDLIPYIENNYSVKAGKENRAIIGFSMGGRESLFIGISRPDLFECIGAISPAPGLTPGKDWAMEHPGQMAEAELYIKDKENLPKLLMVCCGTKDSVVGTFPLSYHNIMTENNVEHLWYEVPGADHDSNAIKSGLYNFFIRWFN